MTDKQRDVILIAGTIAIVLLGELLIRGKVI